ncbi:MAG: DUF4349 domain-containing protein [Solirubrobacteraceae bacterium]
MRRNTGLDPIVEQELEALDAALTGERRDPELALIADEVRATAPPMPPGLALRLEAAAASGFPKAAERTRLGWLRRPPLLPALGALGAVLLALVIGASVLRGGPSDDGTVSQIGGGSSSELSSPSGGGANADSAAGGTTSTVPSVALAPPIAEDADAIGRQAPGPRRVRRAAELILSTPIAELQDTSDAVARTADRLGGHVQRSDVAAGDESGQATFDLRIPTARLDEALAALSELGHVQSRTQRSQDITARFTSARSRLHDARAERRALLRALAEAVTSQEIASINARLDIARARIAAAKGDLFGARRAAGLARVNVTVVANPNGDEGAGLGDEGRWTPGQALEDAVDVLSVAAGVAIVALAAAIPAALLALLALLAWRVYRRRSRELALEPRAPAV